MKAKLVTAAVAALALVILLLGRSQAGVIGSSHDLTVQFPGENEVCVFCHAPHQPNTGELPLWNHNLSTESFTMYGTTMLGTVPDPAPNTPSLQCLGCHDGATAMDAYGGSTGTTTMTGAGVLGIDLRDDHPVSIHYDPNKVGAGLDCVRCHLFGSGRPDIIFYNGKTECPSCHDPHNTDNGKFLRVTNQQDTLCLICHNK